MQRNLAWNIIRVRETGSTNSDLVRLASEGKADEGTVIVAESQTAGRGRQGRVWVSRPGAGLYFSILLKPDAPPAQVATLPLAAGVAVAKALERLLPGRRFSIKWPNDIVADRKKLCGILCEAGEKEGGRYVVAGVGINVNIDVDALPPELTEIATSLKMLSGREFGTSSVLAAVLKSLEEVYRLWLIGGIPAIVSELESRDYLRGRRVEMRLLGTPVSGTACGIAETGALLLRRDDGAIEEIYSGEAHIGSAG